MHFFKKFFGKCDKHYVCKGTCGGQSDKEMNCGTQNCAEYDKPMQECSCNCMDCHKKKEDTNDK